MLRQLTEATLTRQEPIDNIPKQPEDSKPEYDHLGEENQVSYHPVITLSPKCFLIIRLYLGIGSMVTFSSKKWLKNTFINIIQSECRSPDISGVYGPIMVKFCEKVGLWAKGAEKYPHFGYLNSSCFQWLANVRKLENFDSGSGHVISG